MKKKLGFILNANKFHAQLIIPIHFVDPKYKKIQIRIKKYYLLNYRDEYSKGDIVFFNPIKYRTYLINK